MTTTNHVYCLQLTHTSVLVMYDSVGYVRCSYIYAHCTYLCVQGNFGLDNGSNAYGFAFVDCAALKFWVGSFSDDASCAVLGALLMQVGFLISYSARTVY